MAIRFPALFIVLLALAAVGPAHTQQAATASTAPTRPFSPGLELSDTLYVSGHLGVDPTGKGAAVDTAKEAHDVLASVEKTLKASGMTMDDLVYVEIYCTDLSLYDTFNREYTRVLSKPYPARDFIGVKELLFGAHFEVMGIAVRHAAKNKKPGPAPTR